MSDPEKTPADEAKSRRWFVILAVVVLIGFTAFVGVITVCAVRIPELRKAKYGMVRPS